MKVLMTVHLVRRNAKSVIWAGKEALAPTGEQDSIGHAIGPRASKSSSSPEEPDSRILRGYCGAKGSGDPGPFHIGPMVHAEEEKRSKTNKENLDCQDILPRTTLSSAEQNHVKGKSHAARSSLLKHPKGNPECSGLAIEAW